MTTKKQAIEFATKFNWTAADAERAFDGLNLKETDEQALLLALVNFAGPELYKRQRLQGAQKAQVTKKSNHIKKIETEFAKQIDEFKEQLEQERSIFVNVISGLYKFGRRFGLEDPWIEALLTTYEEDKKDAA